ncbi:LysM peptidoglycan-binding domain-containing protein [Enterococcus hirae]|nr:LysM peptidoglycan-binding domain-containing protein [Enterococcus hirae]
MKKFMASLVVGAAFGVVFVQGVNAHASEADGVWTPRTVDQIKADIAKAKDNKYTIVWGDTFSGISAATNLTVQKLADMNKIANVDLIYAGNTLVFEGNVVSVQDKENKTIAQTVIQPQDKVDANKPVGKQEDSKQVAEKAKATEKTKETAEKQASDQATKLSDTSAEKTTQSTQATDAQNGTTTTDNGTTNTQSGTNASTGSVESPAQPSTPAEQSGTQTPSQPSTGGNTGGSTTQPTTPSQQSTTGNHGGNTTPAQSTTGGNQGGTVQQPVETPKNNQTQYLNLGNSGMVFNTEAEADAYGWSVVGDPSSQWYTESFGAHELFTTDYENTGKWTVDFFKTGSLSK